MLIASAFMILVIYLSKKYLSSFGNLSIFIYMLNAGVSYILAVLLLGVNEVKDLFKLFLKVFKLKKIGKYNENISSYRGCRLYRSKFLNIS